MEPSQHGLVCMQVVPAADSGFPGALNLVKYREAPPWQSESQRYKSLQMGNAAGLLHPSRTLLWTVKSLLEKGMPPCPTQPFNNHFCLYNNISAPVRDQTSFAACLLSAAAVSSQNRPGMVYFHAMDTHSHASPIHLKATI